jgi:shikimate 5-dehydrogenase
MKFISLSNFPGTTGQYYYTSLFGYYGIDATYTPIGTYDLKKSINNALDDNVAGISISMPFKKEIIHYLDNADSAVIEYESCNTVKIQDGKLYGYNCDLAGVEHVSKTVTGSITILGNGATGQMFEHYLRKTGHTDINVYSRNLNWNDRHAEADTVINCTPYGTANAESPLDFLPKDVKIVIDMSVKKGLLSEQCININYVHGAEFYKHQFLKQFESYIGIKPELTIYEKFENIRI